MERGRFFVASLSALPGQEKGKRTMDEKTSGNEPVPSDENGLIWHFTSLEALPKILLEEDGLLAGHTSFMSDPEDCKPSNRLREIMLELFCSMLPYLQPGSIVTDDAKALVARQFGIGADIATFIACFSPLLDNKKRWKESTRNGGVAIGFNAARLGDALGVDPTISTCISSYDHYKKTLATLDAWERKAPLLSLRLKRENTPKKRIEILCGGWKLLESMKGFARDLVFLKRPKFRWETEFRAACIFENEVPESRLRYIGGKPYVTLALPMHIRNYVDRIVISPRGNRIKSEVVATLIGKAIGLEVGGQTPEGLFFMKRPSSCPKEQNDFNLIVKPLPKETTNV